jgi:hypothetical protein
VDILPRSHSWVRVAVQWIKEGRNDQSCCVDHSDLYLVSVVSMSGKHPSGGDLVL